MPENNDKVHTVSEWRGRVSQQLKDIIDDLKDLKEDSKATNRRIIITKREIEKRVDACESRINRCENKIWYIFGGAVVLAFILTLLARVFF